MRWSVGEPAPEFASSADVRWDEIAGVAECADDGTAPAGVLMRRRGARQADFLPLEAQGVRDLLDAARGRGLICPLQTLVRERE